MHYFFLFYLLVFFHHVHCFDSVQNLHYEKEKCLSQREKELIQHVQQSIVMAENCTSKISTGVLNVQGMSSPKVRHFLNNLCSMSNTHYLEVGSWLGSTWISALYENQNYLSSATAIDNWSEEFGSSHEKFKQNCDDFLKNVSYRMISKDCFTIDLKIFSQPINIYFYDGNHSFDSQESAFTYFDPILDDLFIAVVDDWNWSSVVEGTYSAFNKLNYEILYETALPATVNGDTQNWWNGLYVAVIRKSSL